jgi:putative ABC transport system permease protein
MWQHRFGGAEDVVGRTFRMNGLVYTVIGVAPPDFGGMMPAVTSQMWIPTAMVEHVEPLGNQRNSGPYVGPTRLERRGQHWLWLKGRMRPGVSPAQVRAEFAAIASRLGAEYPETNARERVAVIPSNDVRINPDFDKVLRPVGIVLLAAVGLVLVVACANLANLLLARASNRSREFALRASLGASRGRIARQLLTESCLLGIGGALAGLLLAAAAVRVIGGLLPPEITQVAPLAVDLRVAGFAALLAIICGLLFGAAPAIATARENLALTLRNSERGSSSRAAHRLRGSLVVGTFAFALALCVGAGMFLKSLNAL